MTTTRETYPELIARLYPVRVYFTRYFTRGTLKGLDHNDSIGFVDRAAAAHWVKGIRANSRKGKLDYKLTRVSLQKFFTNYAAL